MPWVLGIAMTLLALLGLAIAAHAADGIMSWVGLFLCAFGVLFTYGVIARHSGRGR
jgi:hypothetical protein